MPDTLYLQWDQIERKTFMSRSPSRLRPAYGRVKKKKNTKKKEEEKKPPSHSVRAIARE